MHIKRILLQSIGKITNLKTESFLAELERTQLACPNEIKLRQWQKLKELLEFSYKESEFYRNRFNQCKLTPNDIKCEDDLKKLPVVTRRDLQKYRSEIISGEYDFFIQSSGATGKTPFQTYLNREAASKKFALYLRHLQRFGWDFDTKIIYFLPACYKNKVVDFKNGIKQCALTFIQNKISHGFFTNREFLFYQNLNPLIDRKQLNYYRNKINSSQNKIILGRIDFLNILAHNLRITHSKIARPKAIVNIGVLLPNTLAKRVSSFFECPIYNIYGSSEFGYIAGSCSKENDLHINEETHYVEISKAGDSYTAHNSFGNITVTDLINYSMPLIRYELGDVGYMENSNCEYHGLRILKVKGRLGNCIERMQGRLLTEEDICDAVFSDENILQFHLIFKNKNESKIQIIKNGGTIMKDLLTDRLNDLGLGKIEIKYLDNPVTASPDKMQHISIL